MRNEKELQELKERIEEVSRELESLTDEELTPVSGGLSSVGQYLAVDKFRAAQSGNSSQSDNNG